MTKTIQHHKPMGHINDNANSQNITTQQVKIQVDCSSQQQQFGPPIPKSRDDIRPTRRRYLILSLFALSSLINAFQWIYLSSITNLLVRYYNVSNVAINWTSMVYMVAYIPLIMPATWLFEQIGLRKAVLMGSLGTTLGATIKCFSCHQNGFSLLMFGQTIAAISQLFILSVPPRLASVWFPDDQVSLANAVGVFGNQFGIALGFVIPQFVVSLGLKQDNEESMMDLNSIESGIYRLFIYVALISLIISISILSLFRDAPKYAPGMARFRQILQENVQPLVALSNQSNNHDHNDNNNISIGNGIMNEHKYPFWTLIAEYGRDRNFILLLIAYGLNVGVFYAISTILNQMFTNHWENPNSLVAQLGLVMVVSGMFGSVISGYILDKTHLYRFVNSFMYFLSLSSTIIFAFVIDWHDKIALYITIISLGFFMTGYLVIGYEISNEITWPRPESVSAGMLNLSAQMFGLVLTFTGSIIVDQYGPFKVNMIFSIFLLIGFFITTVIRTELKRQNAIDTD